MPSGMSYQEGMEMNGTHQHLAYAHDVNLLGEKKKKKTYTKQ
jgi:hypothetical protein